MKSRPIKSDGFTLIELTVVLAILALLMLMVYPTYQHHIVAIKRQQAEMTLLQLANSLENLRAVEGSYKSANEENLHLTELSNRDYQFKLDQATDDAFQISAEPLNNQQKRDQACEILSLNEQGKREISGFDTIADCWP